MNKPQFAKQIALFTLILTSSLVSYAQVQQEKDWILEKKPDALLGTAACVASTKVAASKVSVKTELIMAQGEDKAPLIVLRAKGLAGQVARAYVRPDSKTQYPMLLLSSDAVTGEDTFVLSPMRLPETLQIIAAKSTLDIYFGEGATAILARVSLRGSSVTINRTAACRDSKVILKEALFAELKKDANLAQAQNGTVQDMLAAYQEALRLMNKKATDQLALANHQKAGAGVLAQEKAAADTARTAAQREQDTISSIAAIKAKIVDLQAKIQKAHQELPGFQAARPAAVAAADAANRALAPHIPRVDSLEDDISSAQSEERRISANISGLQSQLSNLQSQVRSLEVETDNARREQQQNEREIQQINSQISQLENDYRLFDERREMERILSNSSSYQSAKRDLERWTRRNRELPVEVERARAASMDANRTLEQCKLEQGKPNPGRPSPPEGGDRPPRQPPGPGRPRLTGNDGGEDGAPPSAPGERNEEGRERERREREESRNSDRDCSREQQQANAAQREFENKRAELQQSDREIANAESNIQRLERDAAQEARQVKDRIRTQIDRLAQDQRVKRDQISRLDSRIRDLQQIEIPRKQREVESVRNEISMAQSQLANTQSRTRQAAASLDSYKRSVGYDQLVANVNSTRSRLNSIDSSIANAQNLIANGPAKVTQTQAEQVAQEQELVRRQAIRAQADSALVAAQALADAHRAQEAQLAEELRLTQEGFVLAKRTTQGISKALYGF